MDFKGLTNNIKIDGLELIKESLSHTEVYLDKQNEANVLLEFLTLQQDIMIKPRAFYFENNHLISKFKILLNYQNLEHLQLTNELIAQIAQTIVNFHNIKVNTTYIKTFNYKEFLDFFYQNQTIEEEILKQKYSFLIKEIDKLQILPKTISHNDLVPGNILIKDNHIQLIDYDYVMLNDKFFDVASFITETCNNDQEAIKKLIEKLITLNYLNKKELDLLNLCIEYQDLLWTLWANYMFSTTNAVIYKDIYQEKLQRVKNRQVIK